MSPPGGAIKIGVMRLHGLLWFHDGSGVHEDKKNEGPRNGLNIFPEVNMFASHVGR